MLFVALLLPPLLAAAIAALVRPYRPTVGWLNAALGVIPLGAALAFGVGVSAGAAAPTFGPGELLRIDSLSALLAICVSGAAAFTLLLSPGVVAAGLMQSRRQTADAQ